MSAIPGNLSRVSNLMASQMLLASISRTNVDLLQVQQQMSSGKRVSTYSDDPIAAGTIGILLQRKAQGQQTLTNLSLAQNSLDSLDQALSDATTLTQSAQSLASSQIGASSSQDVRDAQAVNVNGMLTSLVQIANRQVNGLYIFGGSAPSQPPIQLIHGGYRYVGSGTGMQAQLGQASDVPITLGGDNAIGDTSARLQGSVNLNPSLTPTTRLEDLNGARGLGVSKGTVQFSFNGGPTASVDLSQTDTVQDVASALTSAIHQYETANSVTVLGPGGVSVQNGSIKIDVVGGSPNPNLTFTDPTSGQTGADLGLTQSAFSATNAAGQDLDPKVTLLTPVSALSGITSPLGTVRFRFSDAGNSSIVDVDLSSAQTVGDIKNLIEQQVQGVQVSVNASGTGIDILNQVAGPALSIEPTGTGTDTATQLGIRSFSLTTKASDYNDGRGVRIVDGAVDPTTGSATRALNTDFTIHLGNGQSFDVDLRPQDLTNTQSIIDRINSEFTTAVGQPPENSSAPPLAAGDFTAGISATSGGLTLSQNLPGPPAPGPITVEKDNNSPAIEDLGLDTGTYDQASATFTAQDPAGIHVNNIFTALVQLGDSLRSNNSDGISLAGESLQDQLGRLGESHALVGVYSDRVQTATSQQTNENTTNEVVRSQLQDVDYSEASIRFSLLQTQLQASLQTGASSQQLSLLDFLK